MLGAERDLAAAARKSTPLLSGSAITRRLLVDRCIALSVRLAALVLGLPLVCGSSIPDPIALDAVTTRVPRRQVTI